ncbi:MAG: biopolymer transporter ExbD [bacterium]|nr:biopolymer transporter ExbD [Candidatus Kapabacteria bacterium]
MAIHKAKRVGFVLDMTPLVDVAFLLLTFFMFTAKFKSDAENEQKYDIKRPVASADTTKLPEMGTGIVKIAIDPDTKQTVMFYAVSNESQREPIYKHAKGLTAEDLSKAMVPVADSVVLGNMIMESRRQDNKMKFIVDADRRVKFGEIERVMNTFRSKNATIFNFATVSGDDAPTPGGGS